MFWAFAVALLQPHFDGLHGTQKSNVSRIESTAEWLISRIAYLYYYDVEPFDDVAAVAGDAVAVHFERLVVLLVRSTKFVPALVSAGQPNDSMLIPCPG